MLSRGVKNKLVCLSIVLLVVIVAVSALSIFLLHQWIKAEFPQPPKQDPSPEEYIEKMLLLQQTSDTVRVANVFDFDFDEAYVVYEPYGDEKYYLDKFEVETNVPIFQWDSGRHYRIFFIKNQCIIYDFVYNRNIVDMLQKDVTIYPDTTMTFTTKIFPSGNRVLQITFDDSIVSGMYT